MRTGWILLIGAALSLPALAQSTSEAAPKAKSKAKAKARATAAWPESVERLADLVYQEVDGLRLALDLYLPRSRPKSPLPVVLWVHGGGWSQGSKDRCPATWLAAEGFAVASVQYRLSTQARWPAQIEDCREAVRWLRRQAATHGLDAERIGAWGGSAGGHLVALMGTLPLPENEVVSGRISAVCDWYGPSDLLTMPANVVTATRTRAEVEKSNGALLLGGAVMDRPELARQASALHQVSAGDAAFLIQHGDADPQVPLAQSQRLHEALVAAGVESTLVVLPGAGHGGPAFQTPEVRAQILAFFQKHLGVGRGL